MNEAQHRDNENRFLNGAAEHDAYRQKCDNCKASLPSDSDVKSGAVYGYRDGKTLCWKCLTKNNKARVSERK